MCHKAGRGLLVQGRALQGHGKHHGELRGFWEKGSPLSMTLALLASLGNGLCTQNSVATGYGLVCIAGLLAVTSHICVLKCVTKAL